MVSKRYANKLSKSWKEWSFKILETQSFLICLLIWRIIHDQLRKSNVKEFVDIFLKIFINLKNLEIPLETKRNCSNFLGDVVTQQIPDKLPKKSPFKFCIVIHQQISNRWTVQQNNLFRRENSKVWGTEKRQNRENNYWWLRERWDTDLGNWTPETAAEFCSDKLNSWLIGWIKKAAIRLIQFVLKFGNSKNARIELEAFLSFD